MYHRTGSWAIAATRRTFAAHPERAFALLLPPPPEHSQALTVGVRDARLGTGAKRHAAEQTEGLLQGSAWTKAAEVLNRQDATIQAFLLQTSMLEHLTAPLCDAVRQQAGSQQLLEALERANLFVVSLDAERRWYRYHALFAEALRARLKEAEGVDLQALHLRASQWYAEQGYANEAIQPALHAQAWQQAAELIEQTTPVLLLPGEWDMDHVQLRTFLSRLPEVELRSRPRLCLLAAKLQHTMSSPTQTTVETWLGAAEATLAARLARAIGERAVSTRQESGEHANLRGEIAAFRAYLSGYQAESAITLAYCEAAETLLTPENLAPRAIVA